MRLIKTVFFLFVISASFQLHSETIKVAAAANLRYVIPELTELFSKKTGHQLAVSYAASGTLTTQILHGAPFELFLSADTVYIERLIQAELTQGDAVNYAQAQLALFAATHSTIPLDEGLVGLKETLEQGLLAKIAIANPKHAPYGRLAELELKKSGLWQQVQGYLLKAENASQVVQFSLSSSVSAAFVPYSHIIQPQFALKGKYIKLAATLQQQAIALSGASLIAQQFLEFIQTDDAQVIFEQYGFLVKE